MPAYSLPTDADILCDAIGAGREELTPDAARSILAWKFSRESLDRMRDLLAKGNRGELDPSEARLLESYQRVGLLVDVLHAKARAALAKTSLP